MFPFSWFFSECFVVHQIHYQASVGVKDEEGPEDEAEEEVDGEHVAGGVAGVDEQPAEDDSQLRAGLQNVQPNVGYEGKRAGDTWVWGSFANLLLKGKTLTISLKPTILLN